VGPGFFALNLRCEYRVCERMFTAAANAAGATHLFEIKTGFGVMKS
jgi:hypothetical protein